MKTVGGLRKTRHRGRGLVECVFQEFSCWGVLQSLQKECASISDLDKLFAHFCFGGLVCVHAAIHCEAWSPVAQHGG
jgi:hypothetical protein